MSDRTTEIREALHRIGPLIEGGYGTVITEDNPLIDAARAYADLLDSDPLIIQRDENGEWRFDSSVLDAYPALYELGPKKVKALEALGAQVWPTNNSFIIAATLDALAAVVDTPKENR